MSRSPKKLTVSPKAERRRTLILDAALSIVGDGGVDAITHRNVAERAEVPLGSLTYYFESRDALILESFRHYIRRVEERAAALVEPTVGELSQDHVSLDVIIDLLVKTDSEADLRVVEYEMILHAARHEELARDVRTYRLGFEAQLAAALENLGVPKPIQAARTLLNTVDGFDVERLIRPNENAADLRQRLEIIVDGIRPSCKAEA